MAEDQGETGAELFVLRHRWRVGRKVGRTVYCQLHNAPSDADPLIGVMDTALFAAHIVTLHNAALPPDAPAEIPA